MGHLWALYVSAPAWKNAICMPQTAESQASPRGTGREKRCSADWDVGKLQKNGWRAWKKPLPRFSALSETGWFQPKSSHWISGLKRSNMEKPKVSTMQTTMPPWLFAMYTLSFAQRSMAQSISKRVVSYWLYNMGCSIGVPQNSWFKMEKPIY